MSIVNLWNMISPFYAYFFIISHHHHTLKLQKKTHLSYLPVGFLIYLHLVGNLKEIVWVSAKIICSFTLFHQTLHHRFTWHHGDVHYLGVRTQLRIVQRCTVNHLPSYSLQYWAAKAVPGRGFWVWFELFRHKTSQ